MNCLRKEVDMRRELLTLLKKSEIFYDAQHSEAKIVTNVSCTMTVLSVESMSLISNIRDFGNFSVNIEIN